MTLLTYLSLSAVLLLARPDYRGLLVAVEDRIESISPQSNSTNLIPGAGTVFALSSPVGVPTEEDSLAFLFATDLGPKGPAVYRLESDGHTLLHGEFES